MKILVTGGSGFVGAKYIEEIEKAGFECINYDLPDCDINDTVKFRIMLHEVDMCIHFAAVADLNISIENPDLNFDVNIRGTYNIASICADEKKPLIFISTCCVYGNSLDLIQLEDTTQPKCNEPYATSKVACEAILRGIPNLHYSILRIGTVYGPGQRDELFTGICLNHLRDNKKIYIDGHGKQSRQLIYIDDLVEGIIKATLRFTVTDGETINLCGVEHTSALDTVRAAEQVMGKNATIEHRAQRYGQTFKENISLTKADNLLNWRPTRTFLEGMRETVQKDPRYKI